MTTAPISGGSLYDPSRMEEVWSWVHELRRCVTARQAALELGVTRGAAVALLADLPFHRGSDHEYEVNYSRVARGGDGRMSKSRAHVMPVLPHAQRHMVWIASYVLSDLVARSTF